MTKKLTLHREIGVASVFLTEFNWSTWIVTLSKYQPIIYYSQPIISDIRTIIIHRRPIIYD
ncbi:hypothetical protein GGGNBK_17510 [Sporosarcina sp. ANT_H38]